jgi:hypothetical protein
MLIVVNTGCLFVPLIPTLMHIYGYILKQYNLWFCSYNDDLKKVMNMFIQGNVFVITTVVLKIFSAIIVTI